jgi:hypothetical protein
MKCTLNDTATGHVLPVPPAVLLAPPTPLSCCHHRCSPPLPAVVLGASLSSSLWLSSGPPHSRVPVPPSQCCCRTCTPHCRPPLSAHAGGGSSLLLLLLLLLPIAAGGGLSVAQQRREKLTGDVNVDVSSALVPTPLVCHPLIPCKSGNCRHCCPAVLVVMVVPHPVPLPVAPCFHPMSSCLWQRLGVLWWWW